MVMIPMQAPERITASTRESLYQTIVGRAHHREICSILEKRCDTEMFRRRLAAGQGNAWKGFPWLTLVLGSGCLNVAEDTESLVEDIVESVEAIVDPLAGQLLDSTGLAPADRDLAEHLALPLRDEILPDLHIQLARFTRQLACDRLNLEDPKHVAPKADPVRVDAINVSDQAARFVVLAYLLNRLFHLASSDVPVAPARQFEPEVYVERFANLKADDLGSILHAAIRRLIEVLRINWPQGIGESDVQPFISAFDGYLEALSSSLRAKHCVRFADVRLATDIAWLLATADSNLYPSWSDLLFALACVEPDAAEGVGWQISTRPRFKKPGDEVRLLRDILLQPTERAWSRHSKVSDAGLARDSVFEAAAKILWSQSRRNRRQRDDVRNRRQLAEDLPPAVAILTSFDLELEFALLRAASSEDAEASFFIVMPVSVSPSWGQGQGQGMRPFWLRARVRCTPEAVRCEDWREALVVEEWTVVHSQKVGESLHDGPHIICIAGCPLLRLPSPASGDDATAGLFSDLQAATGLKIGEIRIEHAVTIQEHVALEMADAEFFFRYGKVPMSSSWAIPKWLYSEDTTEGAPSGTNPRFLFMMGVPMEDPAIRRRLASFLLDRGAWTRDSVTENLAASAPEMMDPTLMAMSQEPLRESVGGEEEGGLAAPLVGLVVDRRISIDREDLFHWVGLDVVRDSVVDFCPDLLHYVAHVDDDRGMGAWVPDDCDLGGKS